MVVGDGAGWLSRWNQTEAELVTAAWVGIESWELRGIINLFALCSVNLLDWTRVPTFKKAAIMQPLTFYNFWNVLGTPKGRK